MMLRKSAMILAMATAIVLLTSCGKKADYETINPASVTISCAIFPPMTGSLDDTTETLRQIVKHNAVWEKLCETRS